MSPLFFLFFRKGKPRCPSRAKTNEVQLMEKTKSLRKGNIWLNVFKTDDSRLVVTVNKTYMKRNGEWNRTPFLNPRRGDIHDLMDALQEFHEYEKMIESG